MLDENLPAFFLKPSPDGVKHHQSLYLSYQGSEQQPAYFLQHADPASPSPAHKNCYAAALCDAYNPDVLYGEVLARPNWTQPSLSQEEIRRNGGIPPAPQPVMPQQFTIQLYNPDQQVVCSVKEGKWGASDSYEFSMPETTFRTPSASNLDRGQSDPASLAITPKINFAWRKESKLGKDLTCYMTGKSTDAHEKKKSRRDPDIAIALWRSMREMTIYEPNLGRVDIEDPKGLEVVLLLSAIVIKDLYFSSKDRMTELFNITSTRKLSAGGRKLLSPHQMPVAAASSAALVAHPQPTPNDVKRNSLPKLQTTPPQAAGPAPPLADPRAQWELDAETARLRAQAQAEAQAEAKAAERRRRERARADEAERRRLQKMVEDEQREARRRQAEVEKETERLRKMYGVTPIPQQAARPAANTGAGRQHRPSGSNLQPIPQRSQMSLAPPRPQIGSNGLPIYSNPAASSSAVVMSGANGAGRSNKPAKKKSFWGMRSQSDEGGDQARLRKKGSAMW